MGHVVHGDVKTSKDGLVKSDGDEGVGSCSVVLRCCSLWVSGWFRGRLGFLGKPGKRFMVLASYCEGIGEVM